MVMLSLSQAFAFSRSSLQNENKALKKKHVNRWREGENTHQALGADDGPALAKLKLEARCRTGHKIAVGEPPANPDKILSAKVID